MKIYQVHEMGGEWEDYFDRIIGTFIKKENAEKVKAYCEKSVNEMREQSKKCLHCDEENRCDKWKHDGQGDCDNAILNLSYDEDRTYEIKEVEIEDYETGR